MLEKGALEHSAKSTKYELESSYRDPVHEKFIFLKTAKLPRECEISNFRGCPFIVSLLEIDPESCSDDFGGVESDL